MKRTALTIAAALAASLALAADPQRLTAVEVEPPAPGPSMPADPVPSYEEEPAVIGRPGEPGLFSHPEVWTFWRMIAAARSTGEARRAVVARWGEFPMRFAGTRMLGRTPLRVGVVVYGMDDDHEGFIIGRPRAVVRLEIFEPVSLSGLKRVPVLLAQ